MSAPVTERGRVAGRAATVPAQRSAGTEATRAAASPGEPKVGQRSARRAYARRDDRLRRLVGGRQARTTSPSGRAQFVLLIMVLLAIGLVATLWFSTAAAADSYRLQDARAEALALSQQAERLHREVAVLESAPELANRAAALGMVPVQDPARLVVAPDGGVAVVGRPRAAVGPPQPQPSAPVAPPQAPVAPDAVQPVTPTAPEAASLAAGGGTPAVVAQGEAAQADGATDAVTAEAAAAGADGAGQGTEDDGAADPGTG